MLLLKKIIFIQEKERNFRINKITQLPLKKKWRIYIYSITFYIRIEIRGIHSLLIEILSKLI